MNKFGIVFGAVAVATVAGCKDPNYNRGVMPPSQTEAKEVVLTPDVKPIEVKSVEVESKDEPKVCTCAPGTIHTMPCTCGATGCTCEYVPAPPPPETTTYIVQSGDYLSKISKKFNIKVDAIKKLNNLTSDKIRVGQKLQLPGKVDVGEQKIEKRPQAQQPFKPYTGTTKEITVKAGDTLGALAYGNGCNIRQLKQLNNLKGEKIRVGQKLKVPAEKTKNVVKAKPDEVKKPVEAPTAVASQAAVADGEPVENVTPPVVQETTEKLAEPGANTVAPQVAGEMAVDTPTSTYVVQEGDDVPGIAFSWGVSSAEIRELNNLGDGDVLTPGQIIKIPADARQ